MAKIKIEKTEINKMEKYFMMVLFYFFGFCKSVFIKKVQY